MMWMCLFYSNYMSYLSSNLMHLSIMILMRIISEDEVLHFIIVLFTQLDCHIFLSTVEAALYDIIHIDLH